ncbi:MAG: hypothetical protein Q9227_006949 [Pyrenula ochraceoflavens]
MEMSIAGNDAVGASLPSLDLIIFCAHNAPKPPSLRKNRFILLESSKSLSSATVKRLQAELAAAEQEDEHTPNPEVMVRGGGMTKFQENEEKKYLGPSSGIAMTRLVIELAKQNTAGKSIRDVISISAAKEAREKFDQESSKPTSKVNTYMSDVAAPDLPSRDLMAHLFNIYVSKGKFDNNPQKQDSYDIAQYMLPLLHEPTFRQDIEDVYSGSEDACQNFQVRMVIAISLQRLDAYWAGLADSFYLAALNHLEESVRRRNLSSLQCYVLIAQYSLLTPTRTASYWVVGHAVKLCQDLGLSNEDTVKQSLSGEAFNALEEDMRRRLFWIILSLEFGLAHSLGRPSAFGTTVDHVNVNFFKTCDDRFITPAGITEGAPQIMKKCIAIHFFRMRLLQAEIRRTLYLKKRETPIDDADPWFAEMEAKIDNWVARCPTNDEGSGLSQLWFEGRKNTMIVFLYRPSPQIPEPSLRAAQRCYEASVFNLPLQAHQITAKLVDITWAFTQSLFMALNAILWSLSYPEVRKQHPLGEVTDHIDNALEAISLCSERWPGVNSALYLYKSLAQACLRAYDSEESFVLHSPPKSASPSDQDIPTPPSQFSDISPAGMYLPPLATSHPNFPDLTPVSSTMPPLTPSISNTSAHSTATPTSVSVPQTSFPLNVPPSAGSNTSAPSSFHGNTPPAHTIATPTSVTSMPAGFPMQMPPSNTSVPSAPSSAYPSTPPPMNPMATPTSVMSVSAGFPFTMPPPNAPSPSAPPSIPSNTPPPVENVPPLVPHPPYQLNIQPPFQPSPAIHSTSHSATVSPIPQEPSSAISHPGSGPEFPVPPYPTPALSSIPHYHQHQTSIPASSTYQPTGPSSAPPHHAPPSFPRTYSPTPQVYHPHTDTFDSTDLSASFFKDLPDFPTVPNYDPTYGPVQKQTWTNPFDEVAFEMFTIPGERDRDNSRGSHRNSSLSQEQQSEMLGELERKMSCGEFLGMGGFDVSMADAFGGGEGFGYSNFGGEVAGYGDAIL